MSMNTKRTVAALTIAALLLPGCATRPDNVVASHVSTSRYADRTCKSLVRELEEVQDALRAQSAKLNDKATQDAVVTGVGVILFWPVLFALGNNAGLEGDVARLKGEEQAIRKQMRDADCEAPPVRTAPDAATTSAPSSAAGASPATAQAVSAPTTGTGSMLPVPARRGEGMQ
ncbi:hypothetical protein BURK1_03677 [Burkholderiales bacterium]|nr:hypothetical protein BURK1_03677 [Burkholderiales bacterium]